MKVLASLKPYYYYLIGEKIKTLEIRKSDLKNLPQNVLFYMSKDEKSFEKIPKEFQEKYRKHFGKIGMRVVCDKVYEYTFSHYEAEYRVTHVEQEAMCLNQPELIRYGKGNRLYGWHISDLKIYDKPKELSEFRPICKFEGKDLICNLCPNHEYNGGLFFECRRKVTRPPQSYMFVKEVEQ